MLTVVNSITREFDEKQTTDTQLPLLDKRGLGGVDDTESVHRISSINAPALWAPPLILEGELLTHRISVNIFVEFMLF